MLKEPLPGNGDGEFGRFCDGNEGGSDLLPELDALNAFLISSMLGGRGGGGWSRGGDLRSSFLSLVVVHQQ